MLKVLGGNAKWFHVIEANVNGIVKWPLFHNVAVYGFKTLIKCVVSITTDSRRGQIGFKSVTLQKHICDSIWGFGKK